MTSDNRPDMLLSRLQSAEQIACDRLLAEQSEQRTWSGELSTSALSTATATMALHLYVQSGRAGDRADELGSLVRSGFRGLVDHQNDDGGWGDTTRSFSNISTTMLAHATLTAVAAAGPDREVDREVDRLSEVLAGSESYIERAGGGDAVLARYGTDRTFSVPILTHCALAGLVDWRRVIALPFELAALPPGFYKAVRLPVVSYALPALIAIGLVRFHSRRPRNPLSWCIRRLVRGRVLSVLESVQPEHGGFLEAAPLTSFVAMSLVGCGLADHSVARRAIGFLADTVRADGSWPIDTNLATWVTTLSVQALGDRLPEQDRGPILDWLIGQQYREVHRYTKADPGGWAWTDLPGGVPDADDTAGAVLAVLAVSGDCGSGLDDGSEVSRSIEAGAGWLLSLQNRDGGWPTFCRGWGTLPFDRSSQDITAHVLRALMAWSASSAAAAERVEVPIRRGFEFLERCQRADGAWVPLWFGNQHVADDENPVYGTSRVLAAWWAAGRQDEPSAVRGREWLAGVQNVDGGWGGDANAPSSVEETALSVEALLGRCDGETKLLIGEKQVAGGVEWLMERVESGTWTKSRPIGFYFARLWYFEKLYPLIFTVAALRRARLAGLFTEDSPSRDPHRGT